MKYHNKITYIDNIRFSSRKEAMHYVYLRELERKGTIKNLQLQTKLDFRIDDKKIFTYKPDFEYDDEFGHHYIDVKGVSTQLFRLKKKLIEAYYKIQIELV